MNLLSVENLSKSYSEKILFDQISFGIDEGEKIGVIGVNGTGKSTLLKTIFGLEPQDSGTVIFRNDIEVKYLAQNPQFDNDATVIEQIFEGDTPTMKLIRDYENTLVKVENNPDDEGLQQKLFRLNEQMDLENAWNIESNAKAILNKLGINNYEDKIGQLSGGQKKRVALAQVLISDADFLILDEPTNHLDDSTIEWLETYLNNFKGALIMITHDRYFLDRISNKIYEIDNGKLYTYLGNYSEFLQKKAERIELEQANEVKRQNLFRQELAWIQRGARARSTKQKARIERFEQIKDSKLVVQNNTVDISTGSSRLGKKVINIENISKGYDDKVLISNFEYIIQKNDRIGIVGSNGCGKSTLMNIVTGMIEADEGIVDVGPTVKIGYYSQENRGMDNDVYVIDYIKETAEYITTADGLQP